MGQPVMQWQMLAKEPDKAAEFYSRLFGWHVNANNALGYRKLETGSERGIHGGIWPAPPEGRALVQLFIEVDDLPGTIEQAAALGATVLFPPQTLPDGDQMALLLGPEGLPFGIFKPAQP